MSEKFDLDDDDYLALLSLIENIGGWHLTQLTEESKKRLLPLVCKLLLFQEFTLPEVVAIWNDVLEGKE